MFRVLTITAAVAALAVSASPASAGTSDKPPQRGAVVVLIGANDYGLMETKVPRPGSNGILSGLPS